MAKSNLEDVCVSATPEDVALAKAVRALGFTQGMFSISSDVKTAKPEKRACLKRLMPAKVTDAEKRDSRFRMANACSK